MAECRTDFFVIRNIAYINGIYSLIGILQFEKIAWCMSSEKLYLAHFCEFGLIAPHGLIPTTEKTLAIWLKEILKGKPIKILIEDRNIFFKKVE